jgi:hypothetical protein
MSNLAYIHSQAEPGAGAVVLSVVFEAADGRRWHAVGGGASRREALAFAHESAPAGPAWRLVRVDDLYGD